ncbi:head GIN domain-containing protein [Stakelama marina]|uniref:DUF2807 domain-containing protein n=1 Tax=Stakelama marina TaxID=2826939 RepID=A0A8T4I973_9SPHN|nr:head GIN domain-containing protein [Stakelama marina]MBR0551197.1 DUF2807 domain-containing protein [Stakelama marina]
MFKFLPVLMVITATAANADERRFDTGAFAQIALESSDRVEIVQGDAFFVSATGDPHAVAALNIRQTDGMLIIGRQPDRSGEHGAIITVHMPALRGVRIHGSGEVRVGPMTGGAFSGAVSGSGDLILSNAQFDRVELDVSGSGAIKANGRAADAVILLRGSGEIDTQKLAVKDARITFRGSGQANVEASNSAAIEFHGSGNVTVSGGARCAIERHGDGTVKCR